MADRDTLNRSLGALASELGAIERERRWAGLKGSIGTRNVDLPAPTTLHGSLARPVPSYEPREGDVLDPSTLPIMTFEQVSRIGGFPSDWDWSAAGSETARMQMLANAVAPPVGRMIATCIQNYAAGTIPRKEVPLPKEYRKWLRRKNSLTLDGVNQIITDTRAVFRLLGQRQFTDPDHAIERLKKVPAFGAAGSSRRSNLLRAFHYWVQHEEYRLEVAREGRIRRFGADIPSADFYGPKERKAKGKSGDAAAVG